MASPDARYFGVRDGGRLARVPDPAAVPDAPGAAAADLGGRPGGGLGTKVLREIMDWVFDNTPAEAFWLDVHVENDRARHVYETRGHDGRRGLTTTSIRR
jgi:hypothetical protein